MTPRSFFKIVLKIFGLYFLNGFIAFIPQIVSSVSFMFQAGMNDLGLLATILLGIIFVFGLYGYVTYLLFFRTGKVLEWLKLDKGFDEETFSFDFPQASILTIGLIVVGGVILVNEVPNFCGALYQYIEQRNAFGLLNNRPDFYNVLIPGVKIIIGLLLLGERKRIVNFIDGKQKTESGGQTELP